MEALWNINSKSKTQHSTIGGAMKHQQTKNHSKRDEQKQAMELTVAKLRLGNKLQIKIAL